MSARHERLLKLQKRVRRMMKSYGESVPGDPAEFLAAIAAGKDPREIDSSLYRLVKSIDDNGDEHPSKSDWDLIKWIVLNSGNYQRQPVDIKDSIQAAMKLVEFLHPKQKAVELEGDMKHTIQVLPELTKEELENFKKVFETYF